jgi:hypothetical protein
MATRYHIGREAGTDRESTVLFDSVTGLAFGPLFESTDEADAFICTLAHDPRAYSSRELADSLAEWRAAGSPRSATNPQPKEW